MASSIWSGAQAGASQGGVDGVVKMLSSWNAATEPGAVPRGVGLAPNFYTEQTKLKLSTYDFFEDLTPAGPAAIPAGGSIKAVRIYNHGACSANAPTQKVLDEIGNKLWASFVGALLVDDDNECRTWMNPKRLYPKA